ESGALWQSRYFSYLFLERDLTKPEWGDNFVTHTQPMLTRYILGGWLWAHGYDLFKMPRPYVWDKSLEDNRVTGRVPGEALLRQARAPMVLFATAALAVLYLIGRVLGGALAGVVASVLALSSPLVQETLVRTLPDAPLAFFELL